MRKTEKGKAWGTDTTGLELRNCRMLSMFGVMQCEQEPPGAFPSIQELRNCRREIGCAER